MLWKWGGRGGLGGTQDGANKQCHKGRSVWWGLRRLGLCDGRRKTRRRRRRLAAKQE